MIKLTGVSQSRWSLKKWKELWIFLCPTFVSYFISEPKIHHLYSFITHSQWSYFQSHFCFPHFGYEQRLLVFLLNYSSLVGEGERFLIKPFWNFRLGSLLIFWLVHLPVSFPFRYCCTARFWQLPTSPTPLKIYRNDVSYEQQRNIWQGWQIKFNWGEWEMIRAELIIKDDFKSPS